jgi:hypothetical protein
MQQAEPQTPAPAAAEAATTVEAALVAAAPPTPLEQRQWQRLAQRAVRLAVTAFKDGSTRFTNANVRGTTEATQLTNSLLSQRYMPDLKLPEVLQTVPGLQAAAAAKLHRQQLQHLQQLKELLGEMESALQVCGVLLLLLVVAGYALLDKHCSMPWGVLSLNVWGQLQHLQQLRELLGEMESAVQVCGVLLLLLVVAGYALLEKHCRMPWMCCQRICWGSCITCSS